MTIRSNDNSHYDFLVVGSGLFGSVFAFEMTKRGKTCLVLERRSHVGGNCYTEKIDGINVHKYGAHIFHTSDKEIWDYICQFAQFNSFTNSPVANYNGEIYNLPFNMNTFNKMWGVVTPEQAQEKILEQSQEIVGEPKNLEEHAIKMVGRDIYEKLVKGYTEKQWGTSCKDLPTSLIKRLPVRFTYDNNYFNDIYQGIPTGGYTPIIEKMLEGSDVLLNTDYLENRDTFTKKANQIIYTGTIDSYFDYRYGPLQYRSLRFEHKTLDKQNHQGVAVMNYTDAKTPFTRIIEHKHFEFGKQDKTVITMEYPVEWSQEVEPYYPVNNEDTKEKYDKYRMLAGKEEGVHFGGRLGEYKYYDMHAVIRTALALVEDMIKE